MSLGKKLLYAAQLGACESQAAGSTAEAAHSSSAGDVALEAMGKVDALDQLLAEAADAQVAYPDGRVFEDRDHANKVRAASALTLLKVLCVTPQAAGAEARGANPDAARAMPAEPRGGGVLQRPQGFFRGVPVHRRRARALHRLPDHSPPFSDLRPQHRRHRGGEFCAAAQGTAVAPAAPAAAARALTRTCVRHAAGHVCCGHQGHRVAEIQELADEAVPFEGCARCRQTEKAAAMIERSKKKHGLHTHLPTWSHLHL